MTQIAHFTAAPRAAHPATTFKTISVGDTSPWGTIESVTYFADGITYVSTARHGGFHVDSSLLYRVPIEWRERRHGQNCAVDSCWFEEDCDWSMVGLVFADKFPLAARLAARQTFDDMIKPKLRRRA